MWSEAGAPPLSSLLLSRLSASLSASRDRSGVARVFRGTYFAGAARATEALFSDGGRGDILLVNSAGFYSNDMAATADGFEPHFGVMHLGHFVLTRAVADAARAAGERPLRVVAVASGTHHFCRIFGTGCGLDAAALGALADADDDAGGEALLELDSPLRRDTTRGWGYMRAKVTRSPYRGSGDAGWGGGRGWGVSA